MFIPVHPYYIGMHRLRPRDRSKRLVKRRNRSLHSSKCRAYPAWVDATPASQECAFRSRCPA